MYSFTERYNTFLTEFGDARIMVLSTSKDDHVTSRMMSIVLYNGVFYFQTDKTFRKYEQLSHNPNVALCIENIQIEGICEEVGCPADFSFFCNTYQKRFVNSYKRYTFLENERLFRIKPRFVERWIYIDGMPFMETFDVEKKAYLLTEYKGV